MERKLLEEVNNKNIWISTTGYRTLVILKTLMEKSCTIDELVSIIRTNPVINKSTSKDTIRMGINTLKSADCIINRPSKANSYKYELISHPFVLNFSEEELNCFINLRIKFSKEISWQDVLILNEIYNKISLLTYNDEIIETIKSSQPLINVNKEILKVLSNPDLIGKKVDIIYSSPEFGREEIAIIPQKIIYENDRLYLRCYSLKYHRNSLLNFERIKKIISINQTELFTSEIYYDVIYEVTENCANTFVLKENEEYIINEKNLKRVIAHVENEFLFIQRLLLFGENFKIISPNFFKNKLISKIKLIQKGYEE